MTKAEFNKLLESIIQLMALSAENNQQSKKLIEQETKHKKILTKHKRLLITQKHRQTEIENWRNQFEAQHNEFLKKDEEWKAAFEKRQTAFLAEYKERLARHEQLIANSLTKNEDWTEEIKRNVNFLMLNHAQTETSISNLEVLQNHSAKAHDSLEKLVESFIKQTQEERSELREYMEILISSQERIENVSQKLSRAVINMDKRLKKLENQA